MCGIAGVFIKDPSAVKNHPGFERFMNHLHLGIEGRGKHASGFVAVDRNGKVTMDKSDVEASIFIKDREPMPADPWYVLLHTRYATKGDVKNYLNNHPVIHGTCFTTHNGSIDNDDDLFAKHEFRRTAEVDTEILPALVGATNFDPDKIREIFKDVDGSCAMATIDPVNHPGKVLLLRTNDKSPLYIMDTPKFTVWASTQQTMKDAWGKVLGTPPKHTKFKYVPAWKFLILEGQAEAGTYDLIPRPVVHQTNWAGHYQGGAQIKDPVVGDWVTPGVLEQRKKAREGTIVVDPKVKGVVSADEVRKRVHELRKDKVGRAQTWDERRGSSVGIKWLTCTVCNNMIHEDDFTDTLNRGKMCVDCAETYNLLYEERMTAKADESLNFVDEDGLMEILQKAVPTEKRIKLNKWGDDEAQVHTQVMEFLAEGTGLDIPVLEYIMFRGNLKEMEDGPPELVLLVEKLWDEYDAEYGSLWDEVDPAGTGAFMKVVKEAPKAIGRGRSTKGVTRSTTRRSADTHFSNGNATKRNHKCLFCRARPKVRLVMANRDMADFNYCNKHHTRCAVAGCQEEANHTRKDGIRLCHACARGMKECYADAWLNAQGYSLEAV